jgi:hypothetical protein
VREGAVSAKQVWGSFGAKPAQSEATVRAAAKRRSTRGSPKWGEVEKLPGVGGVNDNVRPRG